jgi:hypothetical protein
VAIERLDQLVARHAVNTVGAAKVEARKIMTSP